MLSNAANFWYPIAMCSSVNEPRDTLLLGETITLGRDGTSYWVRTKIGEILPHIERYGHLWTTLGQPNRDLFTIPEAEAPGRRLVDCGSIKVKCSPLRAVENFLDVAHFPFVHTDILGAEPHTEVERYDVEIREEVDEVWATRVKFYQPQAAQSADGGITTDYMYRVAAPTSAVLYKTCPPRPGEWDIITLFVQPLTEEWCEVWPWIFGARDSSGSHMLHGLCKLCYRKTNTIWSASCCNLSKVVCPFLQQCLHRLSHHCSHHLSHHCSHHHLHQAS